MRIGHGYKIHRIGSVRPLILGGVVIPGVQGLIVDNDGDVVVQALIDALLGAAGSGDSGYYFSGRKDEPSADSFDLLAQVVRELEGHRHRVGNVDITLIAEAPKMAPFTQEMRTNIAGGLHIPVMAVNVKVTTHDEIGEIGCQEAIAAHAVCLLKQI